MNTEKCGKIRPEANNIIQYLQQSLNFETPHKHIQISKKEQISDLPTHITFLLTCTNKRYMDENNNKKKYNPTAYVYAQCLVYIRYIRVGRM